MSERSGGKHRSAQSFLFAGNVVGTGVFFVLTNDWIATKGRVKLRGIWE